ncbi:MAG: hypothetical protein LC798_05350 [Chloroflexi bacterium]|nr:hypothetical protein [Chloroflexota bacterium]
MADPIVADIFVDRVPPKMLPGIVRGLAGIASALVISLAEVTDDDVSMLLAQLDGAIFDR